MLSALGISTYTNFASRVGSNMPVWGIAEKRPKTVMLLKRNKVGINVMPDVHGMGARDAVYLIESRGLKCIVKGRGKVTEQSIGPGMNIKKGQKCIITLE